MTTAPEPPNEARRLAALRRYAILDSEPEPGLDDLVFLAAKSCDTPLAFLSFVDSEREWIKAGIGVGLISARRDQAMCSHTILGTEVLVVPDTQLDARFAGNPFVVGAPRIRFYAGAPVRTPEGLPLGALCVADLSPRELSESEKRALDALARLVEQQLELRLYLGGSAARGAEAIAEHERTRKELERSEASRNAAYLISEAAFSAPGLSAFLRATHAAIRDLMPAENFYVALLDPAAKTLSFPYFVDEFDEPPPTQDLGSGLTEYVIRTGRPLFASPEVFEEMLARGDVESIGASSVDWLGVPLTTPTGTIGALVVQSYEIDKRYRMEDLELLSFVSTQIALAIQRKRTDESRIENETHLRLMMAQLPAVLWTTDHELRFTSSDGSGLESIGLRPGEAVGRSLFEFFGTEDRSHLTIAAHIRALAGEASSFEQIWVGRRFAMRVDSLRSSEGVISGAIGLAIDITERWALEEKLRQSLKMEAIGNLAGGVAHDFNNLLTAILGNSELALERLEANDPMREELEEIRTAGERAASLTQQLLVFGRRQVVETRVLDLNSVVTEAGRMLRRLIGENIELKLDLDAEAGSIRADQGQLLQVVANLAVNARDAMPNGGQLEITTREVAITEPRRYRLFEIPPGRYVLLRIRDTGTGMDAETQERLFEPFFTTKEKGKGTGLGLATVYGIVKQSNGFVLVQSEPGAGTTFEVYLPHAGAERPAEQPEPRVPAPSRGTGTILVVEDEASVRNLARSMLQARGYRVLVAADGESALEIERTHDGALDLLLTDVVMPGLSGPELAERMTERRPGLRVLFVSGYPEDSLGERGVLREGTAFLQKPFSSEVLARKVAASIRAEDPAEA